MSTDNRLFLSQEILALKDVITSDHAAQIQQLSACVDENGGEIRTLMEAVQDLQNLQFDEMQNVRDKLLNLEHALKSSNGLEEISKYMKLESSQLMVIQEKLEALTSQRAPTAGPAVVVDIKETIVLGQGTFGTVYEGIFHGEMVAVKVLRNVDMATLRKLQEEVAIHTEIQSIPGVVRLFGANFDGMKKYIVTELAHGSLHECIYDRKPFIDMSLMSKLKIAVQLTTAMRYVSDLGIIHRDLKPKNVLVFLHAQSEVKVKICDFGSAKHLHAKSLLGETAQGALKGSPKYMAPEVFEKNDFTEKSDVYAMAVLINELFTELEPFREAENIFQLGRLVSVDKMRPKTLSPSSSANIGKLVTLIESAWAHEPSLRCTFGELSDGLKDIALAEIKILETAPLLSSLQQQSTVAPKPHVIVDPDEANRIALVNFFVGLAMTNTYANQLAQTLISHNIASVERLRRKMQADATFLTNLGLDKFDVEEIQRSLLEDWTLTMLFEKVMYCNRREAFEQLHALTTNSNLAKGFLMAVLFYGVNIEGKVIRDEDRAKELAVEVNHFLTTHLKPGGLSSYQHFLTGFLYEYGLHGQKVDHKIAFNNYVTSAEKGYSHAMFIVGYCYEHAVCTAKDLKLAVKWYQKAIDSNNHVQANCNLGYCYEHGLGVMKDIAKAKCYYEFAANQGNTQAQFNFASLCHQSLGDIHAAMKWYRSAAENNYAPAQYNLALLLLGNVQSNPDAVTEAQRWMTAAAQNGHGKAMFALGCCYQFGTHNMMNRDDKLAMEWYRRAAETGYAHAQYNLGLCLETGVGGTEDLGQAQLCYKNAAMQNHAMAQNNLALLLRKENKEHKECKDLFEKSARQGVVQAYFNLGCLEESVGETAPDRIKEAIHWYGKAADHGDIDAAKRVKDLA